ncbi:Retrovirus-related Pol polyprotein from transposon RE1 [Linum perenne]
MSAAAANQQLPSPPTHLAVKLDATNYVLWKLQIEPFLAGYDLKGHVDGSSNAPATTTAEGAINPEYAKWYRQDQLVLGWVINSLSPSVIHTLVGVQTSRVTWISLATTFGSGSPSQIRSLKNQLQSMKLKNDIVADYLQKAKNIADRLQALGKPVDDADLVEYITKGLMPPYRPLIHSLHNRTEPVGYLELHRLMITEELDLAEEETAASLQPQANYTAQFTNGRGRGRRTRDRGTLSSFAGRGGFQTQGRYPPRPAYQATPTPAYQPRPQPPPQYSYNPRPLVCFNCNGVGHHYKMCPSPRQNQPSPQVHYSTSPQPNPPAWTLDSGATHHLTNDLANLALHSEYQGTEQVQLSDVGLYTGFGQPSDAIPRPE